MAIPGEDIYKFNPTSRQYLDREGLIEYTSKIKSKIAEDITADLGKKITAESEARAAGDSALQQSINNLPAKAYSKITAVSGSTTTAVEASGKDSELKLKAGSNVALGVDTTNKTITINATDTKYVAATTSAPGLMSKEDKVKLDGIATNANEYTLLPATSDALGGVMVLANSGIELAPDGKISLTKDKLVQMIGAFAGATASTAGQVGLVPAPAKGSTSLYLKSDGTWGTPTNTVYTHPNSGVKEGTYRSVTVNAQGHVTKGTNPATLGDYGITDAKIVSGTITLGTATITPLTSSSVTATNNTASWGSAVVVGKVGSTDLKFTMPANPNTWRSIKVNTDTAISASTLNLVAGTNIALTPTTSGSVANVTIATSGLDNLYVKKSGDTMSGGLNFPINQRMLSCRTDNDSYITSLSYRSAGNEALVLGLASSVTSFIVKSGLSKAAQDKKDSGWGKDNIGIPSIQVKGQSLYVNSAIDSGVTPQFNFEVGGTSRVTGASYLGTSGSYMIGNATTGAIEFYS